MNPLSINASCFPIRRPASALVLAACLLYAPAATADPSEGLWVGRAILNEVNEVVSAVDENNVRVQTPPATTTPTADQAEIFLIVHVDGGGTARLLKSVAIVDGDDDPLVVSESLLTDPRLFVSHPVARRIASAAFEFGDRRSRQAVESVASAAASAAAGSAASSAQAYSEALAAAQSAVDAAVVPGLPASLHDFLGGTAFQNSPATAASAARDAAVREYAAGLRDQALSNAVRSAVLAGLGTLSQMSDAATLDELPLTGSLSASGTLEGEIFLGAYHPANPFRHRRNPAHRGGYDIGRKIRLTVMQPANDAEFDTTDRGLDRLTGIYEEEIAGLHKPLGSAGNIGLKTRGTFLLDRISGDATLND